MGALHLRTADQQQSTRHRLPHAQAAQPATPFYMRLYFQVLFALMLGISLGYFYPGLAEEMKPLGDGFIKMIRMMIAPLIFITVSVGIAKIGDLKEIGRVGIKALVYFEVLTTLALVIGLIVVNVYKPGVGINADPATLDSKVVAGFVTSAQKLSLTDFLLNVIPATFVDAFAKGDILQVLFISVFFGLALSHFKDHTRLLVEILDQASHGLFGIIGLIMIVHEATRTSGFGAELSALIQEKCFYHLEAPVVRVTGWDTPYPHAQEWDYFPGPDRVGRALTRLMES